MTEIVPENESLIQIKLENINFIKQQYDLFRELQKKVLEDGIDFGYPAGKKVQSQKPSLYKSGAEKLTRLFNLIADFQLEKEIEREDFIFYQFRCTLRTTAGTIVGVGYGACNSREKNVWNSNPWVFQNTILKMAKKRAHVDAVLTGLGASNVFTQDLEDLEEIHQEKEAPTPAVEPVTEKQLKMLRVLIKQVAQLTETNEEEIKKEIKEKWNVEHAKSLTKQQATEIITYLQNLSDRLSGGQ